MKVYLYALICLFLTAVSACRRPDGNPTVDVVPLYEDIYGFNRLDTAAQLELMCADSVELAAFMTVVSGEPLDRGLVEMWASSRAVEVFTPLVDSVFEQKPVVAPVLSKILDNAAREGIVLPERHYAEVVYGRPESILFVDSVMLVALNHYLGADFEGYSHLPAYMRLVKNREMIPYDMAEALVATAYPFEEGAEPTTLSRLLYEGALAYIKELLVPDSNTELALGFTPEQYHWLQKNEKGLWHALVSKGLLFDTSESSASRLVDPAPACPDLYPEAPGRTGRYIGYRMLRSYLKKRKGNVRPDYLLSPEFYNDKNILTEISYNP